MTRDNAPGRRRFDADELGDGDWRELHDGLETGRRLEGSIDDVPVRVSPGFNRRVMAAVANEPAPGSVGFMTPLRRRGMLAGFAESVRRAWSAISAPGLPAFARATALAYVLVVAVAGVALAGAATISVGGALGVFGPAPTTTHAPSDVPTPSLRTLAPPTVPTATDGDDNAEPSETPDASAGAGGPGGTGEPGDDGGGGNSGPGSSGSGSGGGDDHASPGSSGGSDDGSGSGSGSGSGESATPRPTDTPRPSGTPKPSETPH